MTQKNYFEGSYIGCDTSSGLGFPDWSLLSRAFNIPSLELSSNWHADPAFLQLWNTNGPAIFLVPIDPEQTYFPKITSKVNASGGMESNPLHLMSPDLPQDISEFALKYMTITF